MKAEHHHGLRGRWALALACVVLFAVGGFVVMRSHSHRSNLITMDSNGIMRVGGVSLQNTNLRNAAFKVVSHLNDRKISFSVAGPTTITNLPEMLQAMGRAGITSVVIQSKGVSVGFDEGVSKATSGSGQVRAQTNQTSVTAGFGR